MNRVFTLLILLIAAWSCKNDDDATAAIAVPPRLLAEVVIENDVELQTYFQTHFYNYEEFENPPANFDFKVVIDTIADENADKRPLLNDVTSQAFNVSSVDFGLQVEENDISHKLYFLEVREGEGSKPTVGDNTALRYEGSLLDGTLFDGATTPVVFYPPTLIRGFGTGITGFGTGNDIIENGDGTLDFGNYGIGVLFIPSGLAYANGTGPGGNLPSYANLIFKIDNLSVEENTDFDGDGIPSIQEDLNGDGNLNNDNTDVDTELFTFIPNHADPDDDGDGILTIDEIEIDAEGNITFPDTDGDGTVDYLDSDS